MTDSPLNFLTSSWTASTTHMYFLKSDVDELSATDTRSTTLKAGDVTPGFKYITVTTSGYSSS